MSKILSVFKGKGKNNSDKKAPEAGFQKAKTGALMSRATLLVNDTDHTLYLRDKVGAAYGGTRYKILGKSSIEVTPLQHTFFKMIAYAVEEDKNAEGGGSEADGSSEPAGSAGVANKKKMSTDTNLTIDSDQLADNNKITIKQNNDGKYDIEFSPR